MPTFSVRTCAIIFCAGFLGASVMTHDCVFHSPDITIDSEYLRGMLKRLPSRSRVLRLHHEDIMIVVIQDNTTLMWHHCNDSHYQKFPKITVLYKYIIITYIYIYNLYNHNTPGIYTPNKRWFAVVTFLYINCRRMQIQKMFLFQWRHVSDRALRIIVG